MRETAQVSGEIRILDSTGEVERMIAFTEMDENCRIHLSVSGYVVLFAAISNEEYRAPPEWH
jgi:hypothetical protein